MCGSNRGIVVAIAGLVAVVSAGLGSYFTSLNYPEEQRYQRYRYAVDQQPTIDPAAPTSASNSQSLEYREPCREPKGRDESELCAEWRSAKAGEESARWAQWGFWVSVGALFGLLFTLYYTREAVRVASEATEDAETALQLAQKNAEAAAQAASGSLAAAEAMQGLLTETRKMNAVALRPQVAIRAAHLTFDERLNPCISVATHNTSSYVASDWEFDAVIRYRTDAGGERKSSIYPWGKRGLAGVNLPAGDTSERIPHVFNLPLEAQEVDAMRGLVPGGLTVFVAIFTRSFDVFGNQVDDRMHFAVTILRSGPSDDTFKLHPVPPGARVAGDEDEKPKLTSA